MGNDIEDGNDDVIWDQLYRGSSDYSQDVKVPPAVAQVDEAVQYEDMSGTDSRRSGADDSAMFSYITGWHPFLRFLYRTADMKYAFLPDPKQRAYRFITSHKRTFWLCFWFDWFIVLIGSAGVIGLAIVAIIKTLGFV